MLTTLAICLCLATHLHAGVIISSNNAISVSSSTISTLDPLPLNANNPTPSSSHVVVENELAKISTTCFSSRDYERLAGNAFKHGIARTFSTNLLSESAMSIGLAELRKTLNFAPQRPWGPFNGTLPREHELASASSVAAYYELREPRFSTQSLDSLYFFENNIATAIAYLDKRLPSFRIIFRRRFEEMHQFNRGSIDRKAIDCWIDELLAIHDKIDKAIWQMKKNDYKCWD